MNSIFGFKDKQFYSLLIKLALPITFQYFISSSLYFVDNIFVGLLGPKEAAAIMAANSIYGVLYITCFGLISGCTIFYSQYWGSKDIAGVRRVMGINLIGVLSITLTFVILMQTIPESLLSLFTNDPEIIGYAQQFISVSSFGFLFNMTSFTLASVLRSCNIVRLPMVSSIIALVINTFLNWALIFGNLGLPRLELMGSGIATLISSFIDLAIILTVTYIKKLPTAVKIRDMRFGKALLKKVSSRVMPVFCIEFFWSIGGVFLFPIFISTMGTDALTAMSLNTVTDRLSFTLFMGLCNAIAIIIGNKIGGNEEEKAYIYGKRILTLGPIIGVAISILVILLRPVLINIYGYPESVNKLAMDFMFIAASAVPFIVYNFFMLVGVLRAGGDTRFCMIVDLLCMYLVSIPLVALLVYVFKAPAQTVFAIYYSGEVIKIIFTTLRFKSKKWIVNLVNPQASLASAEKAAAD